MSTVKAMLSKNANYIYHMLSVSKCGYDNAYGEKYKIYHPDSDLDTLKKWEKHMTVSGGEHCGELYGICVTLPSSLEDDSLIEYFTALADLFETESLEPNFKRYKPIYKTAFLAFQINFNREVHRNLFESCLPLKTAIVEISKVFLANLSSYSENIWSAREKELTEAVEKLNDMFSKSECAEKWEKTLGCKYKYDHFYAVLCNSIQGGPQAIDICYNKDVFDLPEDYNMAVNFISHEFGIYLLKDVLSDTPAFRDFSCYKITESLAEYFNRTITGVQHSFVRYDEEAIQFYAALRKSNPTIGVKEMFLRAKEAFISIE